MKIELKCFATLAESEACDYRDASSYHLEDGATVRDLLHAADIPESSVKLVFVNGKSERIGAPLAEGDRVGLAPAVGGM